MLFYFSVARKISYSRPSAIIAGNLLIIIILIITFIPFTTIYYLQVSARVLSKLVTNGYFRVRKTSAKNIFEALILKQIRKNAIDAIDIFVMFLE